MRHALARFKSINWTFETAKTNSGLHGIHPYPAKFVPQLPRWLLDVFHPIVPAPVLDPFCGSGTTLVECQARGIPSFGIDLNPVAALISRVKTDPPEREILTVATHVANTAIATRAGALPNIPRLDHWFSVGAAIALHKLTDNFEGIADRRVRDALRLALSRIIVRVSRQESDTRYAAIDRTISEQGVYDLFLDSARTLDNAFRLQRQNLFRSFAPSGVLTRDILTIEPDDLPYRFGLIITSPPYPNAYEYWLYHKYRLYWLGEDPVAVRNAEIGARSHYFKRHPATAEDFQVQLARCFRLFQRTTLPFAIVCMVLGSSTIRGQVVDNVSLARDAAEENGFRHLASAVRRIPNTRKAFNPAHGSINHETVTVFQRVDP